MLDDEINKLKGQEKEDNRSESLDNYVPLQLNKFNLVSFHPLDRQDKK